MSVGYLYLYTHVIVHIRSEPYIINLPTPWCALRSTPPPHPPPLWPRSVLTCIVCEQIIDGGGGGGGGVGGGGEGPWRVRGLALGEGVCMASLLCMVFNI